MVLAGTYADMLRIEAASVEVQHLHAVGTIPGVAILAAAGRCGTGTGRIRSRRDGTRLQFKAPGSSTYGRVVHVAANGNYLLMDGDDADKWVRVAVYASHLLASPAEAAVFLKDVYENAVSHDDVTAGEASAGDITTYTLSMSNVSNVHLSQVKVWLTQYSGDAAVALEISDDGASWVAPTTEGTALVMADIAPSGTVTLHIRRTVTAASDSDADVLGRIHYSFSGI